MAGSNIPVGLQRSRDVPYFFNCWHRPTPLVINVALPIPLACRPKTILGLHISVLPRKPPRHVRRPDHDPIRLAQPVSEPAEFATPIRSGPEPSQALAESR